MRVTDAARVLRGALNRASMSPTEQAALRTLNSGRTVPIMMSKPLPSPPSIAESAHADTVGRDRGRIVAAKAQAVERALERAVPARSAGTSQSVLRPASGCSGWDDQTYAVAFDADVIQLFRAFSTTLIAVASWPC